MGGSASPVPTSLTTSSGVSLSFGFDAPYTGGFNPVPRVTTFHFDNDISFDTTGIPQCPLASIANQTRADALSACPGSVVGSGNAQFNAGSFTAVLDAFNGQPSGGEATIYVHISLNNDTVDYAVVGPLAPSTRGGDFGTELDLVWPNTPGIAPTHFAVTLDNLQPAPGHNYVSARCSDLDRVLNYAGDFTYYDSTTVAPSATQSCTPTGQRAAALKKCKKKQSKKARKKCRKKAQLLPV